MKKLSTIQKRNNLNSVYVDETVGAGGGHHDYVVVNNDTHNALLEVKFQCGARNEPNSCYGVLDGDLLEIVRDRLKTFQAGKYATRENSVAPRTSTSRGITLIKLHNSMTTI